MYGISQSANGKDWKITLQRERIDLSKTFSFSSLAKSKPHSCVRRHAIGAENPQPRFSA